MLKEKKTKSISSSNFKDCDAKSKYPLIIYKNALFKLLSFMNLAQISQNSLY